MDVLDNSIDNALLEGARQYFMGVPKPAQGEGSGQQMWPTGAPLHEEGTPAQSGAPAPSSRPPSAAAAPPPPATPIASPPRPPSEPIEPEPHIIHKATVMREAAEKRREQPDIEDEEEPVDTLSPPSHIIHKPPPPTLSSPAPAPAAPSPSPARPPSVTAATLTPAPAPESSLEPPVQYRPPVHRVQTPTAKPPDHYPPSRPPDPYFASRPPETYRNYHYEPSVRSDGGRNSQGPIASPQPSLPARHSPQTYARLSSSMPHHTAARLREAAAQSPPSQRYPLPPVQPPPPHNDRVPPIHHPQTPPMQKLISVDSRSSHIYPTSHLRRETSPYARSATHYERHSGATPTLPPRKYDPQEAFSGYRPSSSHSHPSASHRIEPHQLAYKHMTMESVNTHYAAARPSDRPVAPTSAPHLQDATRVPSRPDYPNSRTIDARNYNYTSPSTSASRYGPSAPVVKTPISNSRTYRASTAPKEYEFTTTTTVQTSPAKSNIKSGFPNQQAARMTVSVTSLVNQMNQTKQKRESPLDLSVKTVKNSADSSTIQDDMVDSVSLENKAIPLQPRSLSNSRHVPLPAPGYVAAHKVDFAPNFTQYGDRSVPHSFAAPQQPGHPLVRYNGSYEGRRPIAEAYPVECPQQIYSERNKYGVPVSRTEYVPRVDLTRPTSEQRNPDSRLRDDRNIIIDERKRPAGPIVSNVPEKIVRYETWSADSRIDRMSQSAREQQELMSQPVYSYSSHKQFEAYQNEQKRVASSLAHRDHPSHSSNRYHSVPYPVEIPPRDHSSDYRNHHYDRNPSVNNRHVIQKIPNHRELHPHHSDPNRIPADKRVLSILRNSLEIKQTGCIEAPRVPKPIPDLIVIDDADDTVIEITDLTKDNDSETNDKKVKTSEAQVASNINHHIQMPKAVDSLPRDSEYRKLENVDIKSKSPENDVASRIRTKAELKVMPPSQDNQTKADSKPSENKLMPKSQKQHLFNQIREDILRLQSVIKSEKSSESEIPEVKSEPMNIDEIEKDALSVKSESILDNAGLDDLSSPVDHAPEDLDWANACDNFMEQLKSGCHKKKSQRRRAETMSTDHESDTKIDKSCSLDPDENESNKSVEEPVKIKEEPLDDDDIVLQNHALLFVNSDTSKLESQKQESQKLEPSQPDLSKSDILNPECNITEPQQQKSEDPKSYEVEITEVTKNKLTDHPAEHSKALTQKIEAQKSIKLKDNVKSKIDRNKMERRHKETEKAKKTKTKKIKQENTETGTPTISVKKEPKDKTPVTADKPLKTVIKEELESTDDDEPLIKSKILKEKEQTERLKYQLLKDLSEKSAYVKLECCNVDVNKNNRKSLEYTRDKEDKPNKGKLLRQTLRGKGKSISTENDKNDKQKPNNSSTDSEDDEVTVTSRLRLRKNIKVEDSKDTQTPKTPAKSSPLKKIDNNSSTSNSSTPICKPDFGDGSAFHPGWEEELYKYKRSIRMPTRLIAIPRGRSGGPFVRGSGALFTRGSTSLPDLDPAPLSPAPSSAPSAATDDLYARRQDKLTLDSDLDSNSSYSAPNRLQYDSEASTSTVFSLTKPKKKSSSIVDVLIEKCGRKEDTKKKSKDKEDKTPKVIPKNLNELLPTPGLGLIKNGNKGNLSAKKEKLMEEIFYVGAFRKETVSAFRPIFQKNTDGLLGATEEFAPVVLQSRTRTESRVLKQRATIKEVFGDERPASAPPISCKDEHCLENKKEENIVVEIKKELIEPKPKLKPKKITKGKLKRRSGSIRDGLRSTSLKRNDAKGRLMRLKKRNSMIKPLTTKRIKDMSGHKHKNENNATAEDKTKSKEESGSLPPVEVNTKRRLKRLIGRKKFSSGFDYIRKKKKIIRREESKNKIRRPAVKPSPESVHDIQKEIKGWFINKSIGETHLHRAARLGYTDCVAYCLEKLESDPSAKDNAGFTPLHVASAKGHVRIARLLLQYGANVSAAAQGGIRPLHEACENCHVEVIRLLLAYGADPLLGTYAGQTPEELTEGIAAKLLRLHIADVQGLAVEPWRFPPPAEITDREELGCDALSSPPPASPPPPPDATIEIQCTEAPLPPFYSLRTAPGQPADGLWCLLQDITNLLQIKSKESLLKQIHCGPGSPKELLREIRTQEFLERAQCHQLLCAGEKVNVRASKVALIRVTDKLRQLLKIETVLVS